MRRHHILIPLAAVLATLPLILYGCSCGHDFDFHLQSWVDAAYQLRHGTLYPHWAFSPAWNAGEPRFLFYPPLSWLLGAILTLIFPIAATPALFTFIALTAAGFSMHRLASHFTSPNAALLAATLYLANPYMLFNAFERTAYAELLAAAWIPLLLLAALRKRPTIPGIAIPIALLWLTNAPAAVMGSYAFAVLAAIRLVSTVYTRKRSNLADSSAQHFMDCHPERSEGPASCPPDLKSIPKPQHQLATYLAGITLGLTLPAFYLIPAAYERRYVQIAMAIIPNMRIQDNFLFGHTADAPHNTVLHTASLLAVTLLTLTFAVIILVVIKGRHSERSEEPLYFNRSGNTAPIGENAPRHSQILSLLVLTLLIAILLTPISTPIWLHLPELSFLQFPWRLLTILSAILTFTIALLFNRANTSGAPFIAWPHRAMSGKAIKFIAPLCALALSLLCIHLYRQPCDDTSTPTAVSQSFNTHHGVQPTDEYTPTNADNDVIRPNDPAYWLSTDPNAFAPNTTPNPGGTDPTFDGFFPADQAVSGRAPLHLEFHADKKEFLILNLRDYPTWDVGESDSNSLEFVHPPHIPRDDGLVAIPLYYPADYKVDIRWHTSADQQLGFILSIFAMALLAFSAYRSRKLN